MQVGELHILQRHHILRIVCDNHIRPDLLRITEHGGNVCEHRLTELEGVRSGREIVDRVMPEVRWEYECVGTSTAIEDIVWSANQGRGATAGIQRLTTR